MKIISLSRLRKRPSHITSAKPPKIYNRTIYHISTMAVKIKCDKTRYCVNHCLIDANLTLPIAPDPRICVILNWIFFSYLIQFDYITKLFCYRVICPYEIGHRQNRRRPGTTFALFLAISRKRWTRLALCAGHVAGNHGLCHRGIQHVASKSFKIIVKINGTCGRHVICSVLHAHFKYISLT